MKKNQKFIAEKIDVLWRKINSMEEFKFWRKTPREWPFRWWTWMILCVFHAMYTPHLNIRSLSFIPRTSQLSNVSWMIKRWSNLEAKNLKRLPNLFFLLSALHSLKTFPIFSKLYLPSLTSILSSTSVCCVNVWREGGDGGGGSCTKNLFIGSMRRQRINCENRKKCNTKKIFPISGSLWYP